MEIGPKTQFNVQAYIKAKNVDVLLFNPEFRILLFRFINLAITLEKL